MTSTSQKQSFDLNEDGYVSLDEMETAVKHSFSNVKHDIVELKKVQENGLAEFNRIRKDLDSFIHKDDLSGHAQQVKDFVLSLEQKLHNKESKLLAHMQVLDRKMAKLSKHMTDNSHLKSHVSGVSKLSSELKEVIDLSHLNKSLHEEIRKLSSDVLSLKHTVKDELHERVAEMEEQLSRFGEKGQYDSQVFITKKELDGLVKKLDTYNIRQKDSLSRQLEDMQKRFLSVESMLKKREVIEGELGELKEHLSSAQELLGLGKHAVTAREEVKVLRKRMADFESHIKETIRTELSKKLAKHDEKMTDVQAFLKTRMADHMQGTITRKDLERALSEISGWDQNLRDTVSELRQEMHELKRKGKGIDEFRREMKTVEKAVKNLENTKADLSDVTKHNVSRHKFLKETTQIDNDLKDIKGKIGDYESMLKAGGPSEKKLKDLSKALAGLETKLQAQAEFIREIKGLIDHDIKEIKKLY